jgi:adenylate cyclase
MIFRLTKKVRISLPDLASMRVVALATIAISGVLLSVRQLGGLQHLELLAYDKMVRLRPQQTTLDPRILIIEITEEDITAQQQWPVSDQVLAKVLQKLQRFQPVVIGVDLYRNLPVEPGYKELIEQLKQPNLIAIQSIDSRAGIAAPKAVLPNQIGFNDVPLDLDNVVRRNLLFAEGDNGVLYSFSLRLSLAYLKQQGITTQPSTKNPNDMQLGVAVFEKLQKNSGGYQNLEADGYQILLNYRSALDLAQRISFSDFLNKSIDPNLVKGKIVLIGSTAPSLKDRFATPYSPALKENFQMPGVLIHAQMVSQILDTATGKRPLIWFWSEEVEILWIVSWILLGGIIGRITYHPITLAISSIASLAALSGTCFYLFINAGWVPLASPALSFLVMASFVVTYRAYHAQQKQQIIMKLLGQNTSPAIAEALWKGRDYLLQSGKLPGVRLTATMFFADIKDFSTISEQMTPEALLEWLNQLLEVMNHEIIKNQGVVNKFTGDGLMAIFGVPTIRMHVREVAEDARRAVSCAMAISDRLEEMNQKWQRLNLPVIQMRIGIFTGPVVAGSLGSKDRLEYGVLGDSVNTAARLEGCEKERQPSNCRVLIGHETFVHLQGEFEVESWGPLALKGKQQMVDVYRVIKSRQAPPSAITIISSPDAELSNESKF